MISRSALKDILLLSYPVILTNLMQTCMTIIDTLMVGRLGPIEIAAIGMGNTIRLLILVTILSVSGGAMSLMAQAKGGRNPIRMSFVTRQSIVSGLMLSVLIAIVGILLTKPLLSFMNNGNNSEVVSLGTDYLYVIFLASPFIISNFTVNRLMQGAGDMRTPLLLTSLLLILNVALNYIFIFGYGPVPAYGILGAAIGTLIARFIVTIIGIAIFYSHKNVVKILPGSWKPDSSLIKDILSIGIPSGIQGIFRHGSNLIIMSIITATSLGTFGAAALAICIQIESIAAQTAVGLNVAATAIVGQTLGKWQPQLAYQKGTELIWTGFAFMCILVIPMIFFAKELVLLFDPSATIDILKGAISYLHSNTLFLPVSAFAILITGTLRGAGDTKPAMISAIIGRNLTTIILAYIFAFPMGLDYNGVWYGIIAGRFVDSIYLWLTWQSKKWTLVSLKKTELYRMHLKSMDLTTIKKFLDEYRTPQMAMASTIEIVNPDSVTYRRPDGDISIQFEEGKFHRLS